jgi:hypothetical protein
MWMPPNVPNGGRHVPQELVASKGTMEDGTKRTVGLESQTKYWATPKANDSEKRGNVAHRPHMPELVGQAPAWPAPKGTDGTKGGPNQAGSKGDLMLPSAAAQWPTPVANDDNKSPEAHLAMKARMKGGPRQTITSLQVLVQQWPTPAARDSKGANSEQHALVTGGGRKHMDQLSNFVAPFFAPGPADARWPAILREWPGLAPALDKTAESGLRGVADGLADRSHDCRAQRLKCVGNGVVALQAAAAAVVLVRRMMETA